MIKRSTPAVLVAGALFVAFLGWWSFSLIKEEIQHSVGKSMQTTLSITQQGLRSWVEENTHTVNTLARSPQVVSLTNQLLKVPRTPKALINSPAQNQARSLFRPLLDSHELRGFFIIAPDNISLASTRDSNTGTKNLLTKLPNSLQDLWEGKTIVSLPQASDVPLKNRDGVLTPNYPTMFMGAPIKDESNQVIALLTMRIDPFNNFTKVLQRGRVGDSGETFAFNRNGVLISNSRFDDKLQKLGIIEGNSVSMLNVHLRVPNEAPSSTSSSATSEQTQPFTRMAQSAISGQSGFSLQKYPDYRGIEVVGAWVWDSKLGMGIATEQDAVEAFHTLQSARNIFAIFCSIIFGGFVFTTLSSEFKQRRLVGEIEARKASEKELEKLSIAVDQSSASVVITDLDGTIEYVNPRFTEVTGYLSSEAIGKNPKILQSGKISPDIYEDMWRQLTSGEPWSGELINKRKNGDEYIEFATIAPLVDENGTATNYVAVKEDITERKTTEEALRRSQKMDAIGELTGGLAHDFNNLLGIVIGNLDLMSGKIDPESKLQERLVTAQNAALRGAELTRRLLNFSRQSPQAHSPINVNEVLADVEKLISKSLTSNISFEPTLDENLWMSELDPGDLEDAIVNLSLNARDAMESGGRVIIETRNIILDENAANFKSDVKPGEYVEIAVSDNGSGMSKEVSEKIFEPFFSTKEKDKGTGLGLAMVYGFVQRSKGHISVYSEEGIGTTFRIYLPRSLSVSERTVKRSENREAAPKGTETILIVDDEKELAAVAEGILDELGYTTICANSGDEALRALKENGSIDLVFSDVVMPGSIGGFELAEAVSIEYPSVRVLLTSGFTGKMKISKSFKKWENELVFKPYRDIELAKRIRQTLDAGA